MKICLGHGEKTPWAEETLTQNNLFIDPAASSYLLCQQTVFIPEKNILANTNTICAHYIVLRIKWSLGERMEKYVLNGGIYHCQLSAANLKNDCMQLTFKI